jgi:hypothetical protein
MSIPTGDNAFLHELELAVRTELTRAETSRRIDRFVYRRSRAVSDLGAEWERQSAVRQGQTRSHQVMYRL